ncbi:MAG: TolC family protein [Myxococcales bacterium]|nr:TolC family protein [Myxococcales bacterium]
MLPILLIFALLLLAPIAALADERPELELHHALERALAHNKELAAFEHRLTEQAGRVEQAGLLPNPELSLEVEEFAGEDTFGGFHRAQTTLSLAWVLERGIRRKRVAAAEARSSLLISEAEILRLEVAGETAERFITSIEEQEHLAKATEAVSHAEAAVAAVYRRVQAGKTATAELARAEAELAQTRLARDDVTHELAIARHRLAAQWGAVTPAFERVRGDLGRIPLPQPFEVFEARVEQSPRVARLLSEERVAEANLRLSEARRWPNLRPRLGVRRIEATDDIALVAEVNVPLPVFNRNQGDIAASRSARARTRAEAEAARVRVSAMLFRAYEELEHHVHRAETLKEEVIPRLARALDETRRGYEKGRYNYFEWRSVQVDLLEAETELIKASAAAHRLVVGLERLTGQQVAAS